MLGYQAHSKNYEIALQMSTEQIIIHLHVTKCFGPQSKDTGTPGKISCLQ